MNTADSQILAQGSFSDAAGGTWKLQSLTAQALGPQLTVRIYGLSAPAAGMGVDQVILTAVPEPGSAMLWLAGLVGMVAQRKLRNRC